MLSFTEPAVTPVEAQAYVTAGGMQGWPEDANHQSQALIRGQRYIAARFNNRWLIEWNADETPDEVKYAIIEAALIEARQPGTLSPVNTPATDKVLVQAGKLAWERVSGTSGVEGYVPRSATIEGLLAGLIRASQGSVSFLMRA